METFIQQGYPQGLAEQQQQQQKDCSIFDKIGNFYTHYKFDGNCGTAQKEPQTAKDCTEATALDTQVEATKELPCKLVKRPNYTRLAVSALIGGAVVWGGTAVAKQQKWIK